MLAYQVVLKGIAEAVAKAQEVKGRYDNLAVPFKKASILVYASIMRNFEAQGRPQAWAPLSPLTMALRRGTAPYKILQDTGNLKGGIVPFDRADEFGAAAHAEYAPLMNFGGTSEARDVTIKEHSRRNPNVATAAEFSVLKALGRGRKATGRVMEHIMHISARAVPARPFMVLQPEDEPKISRVIIDHLNGAANG